MHGTWLSVAWSRQFYAALLRVLKLSDDPLFENQSDRNAWPAMAARLTEKFKTRTRDEWMESFEDQDACVTPVLGLIEAAEHPHNLSRSTFTTVNGRIEPSAAPRFSVTPSSAPKPTPVVGQHTQEVLAELGIDHVEDRSLSPNDRVRSGNETRYVVPQIKMPAKVSRCLS